MKKYVWHLFLCICVLGAVLLSCNVGRISSRILNHFYPEQSFDPAGMQSQLQLKDLEVTEDGSLLALSDDPWIYVDISVLGGRQPVFLDIDVEDYDEDDTLYIYMINSLNLESRKLYQGNNYISMSHMEDTDVGVRLDILSKKGKTAKINQIVVNDNAYMTTWFCNVCRNLALVGIGLLFYLAMREVKKRCEGNAEIAEQMQKKRVLIAAASFVLCIIGVATGFWVCLVIGLGLSVFYAEEQSAKGWKWINGIVIAGIGVLIALFSTCLQSEGILRFGKWEEKMILLLLALCAWTAIRKNAGAFVCALFYLWEHVYFLSVITGESFAYVVKYQMLNATTALNLTLVLLLYLGIEGILGKHLGGVVNWIWMLIYAAANMIKLRYNGSFFRKNDLKLYRELFGIMKSYVPFAVMIFIAVIFIGVIAACVIWRKPLGRYLKPGLQIEAVFLGVLVIISAGILNGNAAGIGIDLNNEELKKNVSREIEHDGFAVFTLAEYTGNNNISPPDGYSDAIVQEMEQFRESREKKEEQPTVILILAESLFEVEKVPDLSFNMPILGNLEPYKLADGIAPYYGGGTARAEFEALTGLPDMYFTDGALAYSSYLNSGENGMGGLVREFRNNGYYTVAIHANTESFYSRDAVYANMGFDDFISKEDMEITADDVLGDGYIKDSVFVDYVIDTIENAGQDPLFIFGASIGSHGLYDDKYTVTEVEASSSTYSDAALKEVSKYAQSIYDLDAELGRLFQYCDGLEKPVNVYVFGDHLPSIKLNEEDGYLDDKYKKYGTPIYAYSNYQTFDVESGYLSVFQLAPQILRDSGITYSAYFDAIYDIRDEYPIVQSAWDIDVTDEKIARLYRIEYDLIFGEKYLLK